MTARWKWITLGVSSLVAAATPTSAPAFNESTHELINREAGSLPQLADTLRSQLGMRDGVLTVFTARNGQKRDVLNWLREGGKQEDSPLCRAARHFHNPLHQADGSGNPPWTGTWADAGFKADNVIVPLACLALSFSSSIRWAQEPSQAVGETRSWKVARDSYWLALTDPDPRIREQAFADTFLTLGQQMHLVADASVPEHVRNDGHVLESACRKIRLSCYGSYEWWATDEQDRSETGFIDRFLANPVRPDPAILQQPTGDPLAPVAIARLIDSDTYRGTDPNVTLGRAIGIAEVAHANFFSEDTSGGDPANPRPPFPFPSVGALVPSSRPAPKTGRVRAYWAKGANDGLFVDPVLAECVLDEPAANDGVLNPRKYFCADEAVWENVAKEMLPRAVGHSAALLDYFFRGRLEAYFETPLNQARTFLTIVNRTPGEAMEGSFELYRESLDGRLERVIGWTLSLGPGGRSMPLEVPLTALSFPEPEPYVLVFRGHLGQERDVAVAASWVDGLFAVYLLYNWSGLVGEQTFWYLLDSTPEFAPVFAGHSVFPTGESLLQVICRNLTAVPQRTVINARNDDGSPQQSLVYGWGEASIVEFEPPASIPEMLSWRIRTNPPAVKRVIRPLAAPDFDVVNRSADLTGVRCWGVRLDGPVGDLLARGWLLPE